MEITKLDKLELALRYPDTEEEEHKANAEAWDITPYLWNDFLEEDEGPHREMEKAWAEQS